MRTTHRDYDQEAGDFRLVCRFIMDHNAHLRSHSTWCLGRFADWQYGLYDNRTAVAGFWGRNAHLWFDGFDALVGVAVSEEGDAGFALLTTAGYRWLFAEMLAWVRAHWDAREGRPCTEITEQQTLEADILERQGFAVRSTFIRRSFDLTQELVPRFLLEPGFTIVDMQTHPDYRAQRLLRDEAFGGQAEVSEQELARHLAFYGHTHASPIYHAPCDLCVMAPDGRMVAGCEALIDAHNAEADVERVCTHSAFRRRGFARAVIQECLYRLRDMGLRRAHITGYSPGAIALYGSLGATEELRALVYELTASTPEAESS